MTARTIKDSEINVENLISNIFKKAQFKTNQKIKEIQL